MSPTESFTTDNARNSQILNNAEATSLRKLICKEKVKTAHPVPGVLRTVLRGAANFNSLTLHVHEQGKK